MPEQISSVSPKPMRGRKPKQAIIPPLAVVSSDKQPSKKAQLILLLQRREGATLAELVSATDWLPHTTRAALTGLCKAGHQVEKGKRGDVTCYSIATAA